MDKKEAPTGLASVTSSIATVTFDRGASNTVGSVLDTRTLISRDTITQEVIDAYSPEAGAQQQETISEDENENDNLPRNTKTAREIFKDSDKIANKVMREIAKNLLEKLNNIKQKRQVMVS